MKHGGFKVRPPSRAPIVWLLILLFGLAGCQATSAGALKNPAATSQFSQALAIQSAGATAAAKSASEASAAVMPANTPSNPPEPVQNQVVAEPTPQVNEVYIPWYIPAALHAALQRTGRLHEVDNRGQAGWVLDVVDDAHSGSDGIQWIYALVAPFPTVADEITLEDLKWVWQASDDPDKIQAGSARSLPLETLLVDTATQHIFEQLWGPPGIRVRTAPASRLVDKAWAAKTTWSLVPFEKIEPRWKVIAVDGQSPVQKTFDAHRYGLDVHFGLTGESQAAFPGALLAQVPGNRQPDHLTTVMLTGVTALVRGTASLMEGRGIDYPARDIGDWLREADILHISNEVPFAKNCPDPYNWRDLVFCSRPRYIQLLESVGTDVVELTGDHFADWGSEAMLYTLDLYKQEGWPVYGGGADLEEARQPALLEHHGNKFAFLGCNAKPKGYATASETTPGAAHCDFDRLVQDIQKVRDQGYLPIVTFQHLEYYQYVALPPLQKDFQRVADAGAVIVSGSQAHQPHAFEIRPVGASQEAFLHYGLGNLFFDQTNQGDAPRTAFIDRHVFYEGRHISTELLTIYLVDYARSRPMTLAERQALLETIFQASGW